MSFEDRYRLMTPGEQLSRELRRYRATWGLSQRVVAQRAGTTQRVISQIESGSYNPSLDLMARLAEACGMRLEVAFRIKPRHTKS